MTAPRTPWLLELAEGQWRGEPPHGRLRLRVLGFSRSSVRGWVTVSGWRQFDDAEPRFARVVVRADVFTAHRRSRR